MKSESKELKNKKPYDHSVMYDKTWREYFIYHMKETEYREWQGMDYIYYCPWCGSKLPSSLSDKWYDTLEEEYNIEDPAVKDRRRVPKEFKTDEWWKKRGL